MSKLVFVVAFILFSFISLTKCERILAVFPTPSISHQVVFRPITQELVKRGHEVVVITTDPAFPDGKAPVNLTEINVHDEGYKSWIKFLSDELQNESTDLITHIKAMIKSVLPFFCAEMQSEAVKDIIAKKKGEFDLLITELCVRPALGFSHIFKVPLIQMSSFGSVLYNDDVTGSETHLVLYPDITHRRVYNLTMLEKICAIWNKWILKSFYLSYEEEEDKELQKIFGADIPPLKELKNNIHMTILNTHSLWIDNQPSPPNVVYVGGIHQKPVQPLPKELQSHLDSSKIGVIYVSFGTNVMPSTFHPETQKILLGVLSELPYDVLLKWDQEQLPHKYKNIRVSKWFPQPDLLRVLATTIYITCIAIIFIFKYFCME